MIGVKDKTLEIVAATHRRNLDIGIRHEAKSFLPLAVIHHVAIVVRSTCGIDIRLRLVFLLQVAIALLAHIIVRDA